MSKLEGFRIDKHPFDEFEDFQMMLDSLAVNKQDERKDTLTESFLNEYLEMSERDFALNKQPTQKIAILSDAKRKSSH